MSNNELFKSLKKDDITYPWWDHLLDELKDDWKNTGFIRRLIQLLFPIVYIMLSGHLFYLLTDCACAGGAPPIPVIYIMGAFMTFLIVNPASMLLTWLFGGKPIPILIFLFKRIYD